MAQSEGPLDTATGYTLAVAGAELNVAIGLTRLEHPVSYVTKLGTDPFGKVVLHCLEQNYIDNDCVYYSKTNTTGFMLKSLVSQGDPEIFYYRKGSAASTLSPDDIDPHRFYRLPPISYDGNFPCSLPHHSSSILLCHGEGTPSWSNHYIRS